MSIERASESAVEILATGTRGVSVRRSLDAVEVEWRAALVPPNRRGWVTVASASPALLAIGVAVTAGILFPGPSIGGVWIPWTWLTLGTIPLILAGAAIAAKTRRHRAVISARTVVNDDGTVTPLDGPALVDLRLQDGGELGFATEQLIAAQGPTMHCGVDVVVGDRRQPLARWLSPKQALMVARAAGDALEHVQPHGQADEEAEVALNRLRRAVASKTLG